MLTPFHTHVPASICRTDRLEVPERRGVCKGMVPLKNPFDSRRYSRESHDEMEGQEAVFRVRGDRPGTLTLPVLAGSTVDAAAEVVDWLEESGLNILLRHASYRPVHHTSPANSEMVSPVGVTRTLSTRLPSISTTSILSPSQIKWSAAEGMRPNCMITKPASV